MCNSGNSTSGEARVNILSLIYCKDCHAIAMYMHITTFIDFEESSTIAL